MRIHIEVSGRVQGVGFRWFVMRRARALGLSGWVRNETDGRVTAEAEGGEAALGALTEALAEGPSGARVEAVRSTAIGAGETLPNPFRIR